MARGGGSRSGRPRAEFAALYLGLPLVMALALPPDRVWPCSRGDGARRALARPHPGLRLGELARGWGRIAWGQVAWWAR